MYGSYSSYSSMSTGPMAMPMDIGSTGSTTACAFPSWPRSATLANSRFGSSSSYLSDEDLFLDDFDDNASATSSTCSRSNSNAGSISPPNYRQPDQPFALPPQLPGPSEEELLELQRERQAYQRDLVRGVLLEKERRKQAASAARRQRRAAAAAAATGPTPTGNASSRKKSNKMAIIAEDA